MRANRARTAAQQAIAAMAKASRDAIAGVAPETPLPPEPFELIGRECDECFGQMVASRPPRERRDLEYWAPSHFCLHCGLELRFAAIMRNAPQLRGRTLVAYRRSLPLRPLSSAAEIVLSPLFTVEAAA